MSNSSRYSTVFDQPVDQVWETVRDFNSYPIWVNGVDESHIEEDLSGTAVGGIRNFSMSGSRTRQRLRAHSDVDHFFTYESCDPFEQESNGSARTLLHYQGTLQVRAIVDGNHSYAEWSVTYECPPRDTEYWSRWWKPSLPEWLSSLGRYLDRTASR